MKTSSVTASHLMNREPVKVERSSGAIIFRRQGGKILYLLLQHIRGHWAFPKGHIEAGEKSLEAARREILEETGIKNIRFLGGYREMIRFRFQWPPKTKDAEHRLKFVVHYLGEVFTSVVKLSEEHKAFKWVSYEEAIRLLKHRNAKELLEKADARLTSRRPRPIIRRTKPRVPAPKIARET
jgi:bis(5'-nucleosidyl)-tetraphosphatase